MNPCAWFGLWVDHVPLGALTPEAGGALLLGKAHAYNPTDFTIAGAYEVKLSLGCFNLMPVSIDVMNRLIKVASDLKENEIERLIEGLGGDPRQTR